MEHQESAGKRGETEPHPAQNPRNRTITPTGDRPRMGHCDSPAHVSGYGGVCGADGGTAEVAAATRDRGRSSREFAGRAEREIGSRGGTGFLRAAGKWVLLLFVRFYQIFLSPFFGGACKFYPSCSKYGYEAIARHGAWRGSVLAMKRLLRCRPFTKGGFDPVPDVDEHSGSIAWHGNSSLRESQGKPFANSAQGKQGCAQ
jgi:putative membrane protein insertion efficiency factor